MVDLIGHDIGRYHVIEQLGQGGMATVYKAYDTRLERDVAIKVIRMEAFAQMMTEHMFKRFEREAKSLAKMMHSNIVPIYDYGEHEGSPYLVMAYIPGGTLKNQTGMAISYRQAARLLAPVAHALAYAHSQNVIHRDVKPANILITNSGQPMLSDFGVAKILESEEGNTLTGIGVGIGTPEYMAPEQWVNKVVPQTDIYALGVIFYELVTGRKPYTADTPAAVLLKQANDPLPRPAQYVLDLPDQVEQVIFKALAKKPEDRYANMDDFAFVLDKLSAQTNSILSHNSIPTKNGAQFDLMEDTLAVDSPVKKTIASEGDQSTPSPMSANRRRMPIWTYLVGGVIMLGLIVALLGSGGWIGTILGEKTPSIMTQVDNNGVLATPNPTAKPSPTEMHLPTPAPTLTLAQENFATPTLINRQAESARTFAEPILTAIGQHKPDFSDDFSKVKPAWKNYEDITKGGTFAIVEGVARFRINQGGTFTTNDNALTGKNYVFQVDARLVSGDTTSDITISFHNIGPSGRFSLYLFPATQDWDLRRYSRNSDESLTSGTGNAVSPVGKTTQITIIVRGSQGALYLNQTPQGFLEDEILNHVGKIMLFCNSVTPAVCEFDNIKFWNLENIANLP